MAATVYERGIFRRRHLWTEFAVGSLPCSEMFFFSGYTGFPFPSNINPSRFQFVLERKRLKEWAGSYPVAIYVFVL